MFDPTGDLYRIEELPAELNRSDGSRPVLVHGLSGFVDAGHANRLAVEHLLENLEHRVVATFDVDQLLDYRSRRPMMVFEADHWADYARPELTLHEVRDEDGTAFLLLSGPEPDLQWERFIAAVIDIVERFDVLLTVGLDAVPMAVPHTRPVTMTAHATRPELVAGHEQWFGTVEVPASVSALLELRLGEAGHDAIGFAVHVPHYLARTEYPDSARGLLTSLIDASGLALPTEGLRPAAERVTAEVNEQIGHSEEISGVVRKLEEQFDEAAESRMPRSLLASGVEELPSADELGAELEQFLADRDGRG
ncbi:MAG: PAC2 family protein [Pseudonocardiaceae bacterium]|nr:PAC2 family protein [Pseudonocardiaceae bacterium]